MTELDLSYAGDPANFATGLQEALAEQPGHVHHGGPIETVRRDRYRDHEITIRTTYLIEVDGHPLGGHLSVGRSGDVQVHALPNYTFPSAVDMVRELIDVFPEGMGDGPPDHGGQHGHDHGGAR
jgi:hypothetical protein